MRIATGPFKRLIFLVINRAESRHQVRSKQARARLIRASVSHLPRGSPPPASTSAPLLSASRQSNFAAFSDAELISSSR